MSHTFGSTGVDNSVVIRHFGIGSDQECCVASQQIELGSCNLLPTKQASPGSRESIPEEIEVFPNPSDARLLVKSSQKIIAYQVLNLQGQVLRQVKTDSGRELELDMAPLSDGVYFLDLQLEQGQARRKIVVQH